MKARNIKALSLAISFLASVMGVPVFAANPYGINYSGGQVLGENNNVTINPSLTSELTPIIAGSGRTTVFSNSNKWEEAYMPITTGGEHQCRKVHYFKVWQNDQISSSDNLSFTVSSGVYSSEIRFDKIAIEDVSGASQNAPLVVIVDEKSGILYQQELYSDAQCENAYSNYKIIDRTTGSKIFYQTHISLFYTKDRKPFTAKELFFGMTDIDSAQSYKILNSNNYLSASNMYAESAEGLQPTDTTLRNMFVPSGNYIYSQYTSSAAFNIGEETNDIFVKMDHDTQADGLDVVFGFANHAASSTQFYAKQYVVKYVSDENGEIVGIADENVVSKNQPTGSSSKPKEDYEFTYWTVDKDVKLTDGTTIKAGGKLTAAQVKKVVVEDDLIFTAHHIPAEEEEEPESEVATPDTGAPTGEFNAIFVAMPMLGILLGALMIKMLPRVTHKKIGFNK